MLPRLLGRKWQLAVQPKKFIILIYQNNNKKNHLKLKQAKASKSEAGWSNIIIWNTHQEARRGVGGVWGGVVWCVKELQLLSSDLHPSMSSGLPQEG